jgi:hypothetical protein
MRTVWTVAVVALLALAVEAYADTIYLKDGQTVWGKEVTEEGDTVIVVRPGETLRFPKGDVSRIEQWRMSVPRYYDPPSGAAGSAREAAAPGQPPTPAATPAAEATAPTQTPATVTPPSQASPSGTASAPLTPTVLPPPPPPAANRPQ